MKLVDIELQIEKLGIIEQLMFFAKTFPKRVKFSTSFGLEDQVITHLICQENIDIDIFTLDTGRLFQETYSVWSSTLERYQKKIQVFFPPKEELEQFVREEGPNSFYTSVDNRKRCCHIRKVLPLRRALADTKIWITGLRQEQSKNRQSVKVLEEDVAFSLIKYQPLWNWDFNRMSHFIKEHHIPYHPLHDKGFPSIGCLPCTRAIKEGEDFRAGRWWWEQNNQKECGLHNIK